MLHQDITSIKNKKIKKNKNVRGNDSLLFHTEYYGKIMSYFRIFFVITLQLDIPIEIQEFFSRNVYRIILEKKLLHFDRALSK